MTQQSGGAGSTATTTAQPGAESEEEQVVSSVSYYRRGNVVTLPSGFVARLWRPSMISMIGSGVFPNSLMGIARSMVEGDINMAQMDGEDIQKMVQVIDIAVAKCFLEPKIHPVETDESAVPEGELHISWVPDDDKQFLMNFLQVGVSAIAAFREGREPAAPNRPDSEEVRPETVEPDRSEGQVPGATS